MSSFGVLIERTAAAHNAWQYNQLCQVRSNTRRVYNRETDLLSRRLSLEV